MAPDVQIVSENDCDMLGGRAFLPRIGVNGAMHWGVQQKKGLGNLSDVMIELVHRVGDPADFPPGHGTVFGNCVA
jgi:hypothetical protein